MIKYALKCGEGHEFESWFPDAASFDDQAAQGHVACPLCGTADVAKAIMAPSVASRADRTLAVTAPRPVPEAARNEVAGKLRALRRYVMRTTEDVGPRFPEEVRKIAEGESQDRPIRGEATVDEAKALLEDGIFVLPLPALPEDLN